TEFQNSRFVAEILNPNGFSYAAAAPLNAPLIDGYPGALAVFRRSDQGPFAAEDLRELKTIADEFDQAIARSREARRTQPTKVSHRRAAPPVHIFVLDAELRARFNESGLDALDPSLRQNLLEVARQRFGLVNGKQVAADRVS